MILALTNISGYNVFFFNMKLLKVKITSDCLLNRAVIMTQEIKALREELRFHQAVYQLQADYVLQALDAIR